MPVLEHLEPKSVFHYFEEICKIPHGSKDTKAISDYLVAFAKERNLPVIQDSLNNVIITKPATPGYENVKPIIIQGHTDMVCEKENDCDIDFEKDGLDLYVDGDFVRAKGTTLGGDDGIAVAYALALLDSKDLPHPKLEVVLTVDEEIGMLGAFDIDLSMLEGNMMLNIDSDVEGIFLTSCAGGTSVMANIPVNRVERTGIEVELVVGGLAGGHSGAEIDKEHGNADILMGRVLAKLFEALPFGIRTLAGGLKDNAIPRECVATLLIPDEEVALAKKIVADMDEIFKKEFTHSDAGVFVSLETGKEETKNVLDFVSIHRVLFYLRTVPNGVINMSAAIPGLVETSLNLGIMELKEDTLELLTSIRSSVSTRKEDVRDRVIGLVELLGGECELEGDYPAWEYRAESPLREKIATVYKNLYNEEPKFDAIHAGLECGVLSDKITDLDCVSFGPTNYDIHTPMERLSISSTKRVWEFLCAFLEATNK